MVADETVPSCSAFAENCKPRRARGRAHLPHRLHDRQGSPALKTCTAVCPGSSRRSHTQIKSCLCKNGAFSCIHTVEIPRRAQIYLQTLAVDLLNPSAPAEARRHKLKRLVQSPNSYFMDVKCPGAFMSIDCSWIGLLTCLR